MLAAKPYDAPGLEPAPRPGTAAFEQLVEEITFATFGCETEEQCAAVTLRLMIRRRQWPLGTRYVRGEFVLPPHPPARDSARREIGS